MTKRVLTAAALALCLLAPPAAAQANPPTDTELDTELLEAKLEDLYKTGDHSVIAEVRSGDATWSEAIGPRSMDPGSPEARTGDRVRIASLTKSMIAVVMLQLQDEGELDLDDSVSDHLPGLLPYEDEPTIRQLMQHTGGLSDYFPHLYPSLFENGDMTDLYDHYRDYRAPEELVEIGTQDPPLFEPGTDWSYSNTGYIALGLVIEEATGHWLGHELHRRVFKPAGLRHTYFPPGFTGGIWGPHPVPHTTTGDEADPYFDSTKLSNSHMWAAGAAVSTMEDVNDFYDAFLDGTLLTDEQLAEATEFTDISVGYGYGLGLLGMAVCSADDLVVGHTGGGIGHLTYSFHSLDGQRQVSFTWNVDDWHGYTDPEEFDAALAGLLVAGLCGVDIDDTTGLRTQDLPDFAALDELMHLG
ncbi:beta-lactamase family protein [Glycomyces sp. L485]|uniref:serine hydrolase domain-containing protein n=1 Tax=Glycomyces sp. L485 TaxID=2909235 RepID=UPI001F4B278D|nr:beta-lactamase family protein [Glycomyces sp. L485]MCH7230646.1 beta-lactamase family protein [Glycomyces sp. L485]